MPAYTGIFLANYCAVQDQYVLRADSAFNVESYSPKASRLPKLATNWPSDRVPALLHKIEQEGTSLSLFVSLCVSNRLSAGKVLGPPDDGVADLKAIRAFDGHSIVARLFGLSPSEYFSRWSIGSRPLVSYMTSGLSYAVDGLLERYLQNVA